MIYTVTLNPALDKTVEIPGLTLNTVNRVAAMRTDPGGKGINVSKVIRRLGGESVAVALLAGQCGRQIADACAGLGLTCEFTFTGGETRTNLKIVDPVAHTNTDVNERGLSVENCVLDGMLHSLADKISPGDIVVLAGSLPPDAPPTLYQAWTQTLQAKGAKVFLDADGPSLAHALAAEPYLLKPNYDELSRLMGHEPKGVEEIAAAARKLLNGRTQRVVVSMGSEGALFLTPEVCLWAHGLKVQVCSTVGAGDAMVAALAWSEARMLPLEETVPLAVATSAANVMSSGTQAAEKETVLALLPQVVFEAL